MSTIMYDNTNDEIILEIGRRLRGYRLQQNIPIAELALKGGLSARTVVNVEGGHNPRLESIVRMLRVLGRLDALETFLPPPGISPIQLARMKGRGRQRARRPHDAA